MTPPAVDCEPPPDKWDQVLDILSTLITFKTRADGKGWRDAFEHMPVYLDRLDMRHDLSKLSVIHVAGTKGKGSTCAMTEAMLRAAGYRTGLYTSPHLVDVRERVRINGQLVSKAVFSQHFWWCYDRLKAAANDDVGMPGYFRFLTLLGLRIFLDQKVDVAILEVGLGGRLDATNVIPKPVVCGITSLGFDHMELLGHTLPEIAGEKAGILKPGVPAFTSPQPDDAMAKLRAVAGQVGAPLAPPPRLASFATPGGAPLRMGLAGAHQATNAALAVQLAAAWEAGAGGGAGVAGSAGAASRLAALQRGELPQEYAAGLASCRWPGRSHVIVDAAVSSSSSTAGAANSAAAAPGSAPLVFYLDGAHTPESMDTCGEWFADACSSGTAATSPHATGSGSCDSAASASTRNVLVFNCMAERDPAVLLPALRAALRRRGVRIDAAVFVPPVSQYGFLQSGTTQAAAGMAAAAAPDLSWQQSVRGIWATSVSADSAASCDAPAVSSSGASGGSATLRVPEFAAAGSAADAASGIVLPSLPQTVAWLRGAVAETPGLQLRVLVTGSLYLVGDMLRVLGQPPR